MAINFPNTPGNGSQHTASGITWTYDGTTWKADGVTGSYALPTASATVLGGIKVGSGLTINSGVLAATAGSQTLDQVLSTGNTTTRDIDTTGKIKFSNNYATLGDLPSASTYHGMFAHVHGENHGFFAHAGAWVQLLDTSSSINELSDVTTGTPSAGDVLTWSGSAWAATGATYYTNSDVDTHLNVSAASSGQILSWNGSDYAWVADQTGGGGSSLTVQDEGSALATAATTLNFVGSGVTASGTGAVKTITIAGGGTSYTNSDVDAHLNTSSASSSQILSWNGSDYAWVADQTGGGSGLASRTTGAATASSLANDASANLTITAAKTYALHKIQTSHAAWVTLYTDTTSRTQDASRTDSTDPVAGSGVIAEVITSDGATQKITPGAIGYNDDGTPSTNAYVKVVNKSGNTANVTVTLHFVSLEA